MTSEPKIHLTLSASDTTQLHRAGMAGLWMSLKQLEVLFPSPNHRPGNLSWLLTPKNISLYWQGRDFPILDWLLKQSFQIDRQGLISLTGLNHRAKELINQIHLHQAIKNTFLRHNQFYKSGREVSQVFTIDEVRGTLKYKKLQWYAHQTFAEQLCDSTGQLLQDFIQIVSWLYLGATVRHARLDKYNKLEEKAEYALALLFLPVICQYFILNSNSLKSDKKQPTKYLIVIPEVTNLEISAQRHWQLPNLDYRDFFVANLEEAALKSYSYERVDSQSNEWKRCQVWLYDKWNKKVKQHSLIKIQEVEINAASIYTYQLTCQYFQQNRVFSYQESFLVKINLIRGIIAQNLAQNLPWWWDFWETLYQKDVFGDLAKQLVYNRKGLITMLEHDPNLETYKDFIRAFHEALRNIYAKIYSRTKAGEIPRIEREYERIRSELSRCYDEQTLTDFLSDFLARAGLNSALYERWESILPLIVDEIAWQKTRNLALIALASYKPSEKPTDDSEENTQVIQEA